ncbi:MAG: oligoendopeptidase F [Firmicutes bacterium]|nr:oligoendopeptidase F [Bacillota bacterium]
MTRRLTRAEVPVAETWNLDDLFPSRAEWEAELEAVRRDVGTVTQYKGRFGEGAGVLLECLEAYERLYARLVRVATYADLRAAADGSDPLNQADAARADALEAEVRAALSFLRPEILALPDGTVERYLQEEPRLGDFRKALEEILEQKPYTLAPETEAALAALSEIHQAPYVIYQRAKAADIQLEPIADRDGKELPNSLALYEDRYELHPDTELRRRAFRSFVAGLRRYQHTLGAAFAAEVKKNVVMARLRGYPSATHMLLQPHQVTEEVYRNVLDTVFHELAPHMRRYARLRRRVLGLDTLYVCDLKSPLDPDYNPPVTYEEASELILGALEVLGPEYTQVIRSALTERWVDRADNVGKSTGAFCSSPYGAHPYILITWTGTLRGTFVLAHELGHAGHLYLAQRYNRLVNHRPTTFFIEAPSTLNELLLAGHLLARTDDPRMRRWILTTLLGTYFHNFVTHLLEGELQRRIYALAEAGEPITATTLSETKAAILKEFWGDTVEIEEGAALTWMRQPHYYMGLYPYTYAAGLTISTRVAQQIREEGRPAAERWVEVLKAGGTKRPLELARMAGVDMASPEPIRQAVAYVGSLIDELERLF